MQIAPNGNRPLAALVAAALLLVLAAPAAADFIGEPGRVVSLHVNESTAEEYPTLHGYIHVDDGFELVKYAWSGTYCNGRNLTAEEIALLRTAIGDGRMRIVPQWKSGMIANRCLVAFRLMDKKYVKDLAP